MTARAMSIRVSIDQEVCQAAGYCVRTAPGVFEFDADGVAAVKAGKRTGCGPMDVPEESVGLVRAAVNECPSGAITVSEE
ncbi:ferredoxin [Nocardia crassostreae]|uniref:ferredoxin n=1 Tax=Nocardia crassostreae TaxID=53428 RepID=UPI000B1F3A43|nr:ferredoxin [Nocardia crassostreae]